MHNAHDYRRQANMSSPARIQLSRAPGFRLQTVSRALNGLYAIKVDRSTPFGNPWRVGEPIDMKQARRWGWDISPKGRGFICDAPAEAVRKFEHALLWDEAIHDDIRQRLGGRNLACWCDLADPCHCTPLLAVANSTPDQIHAIHAAIDKRIHRAAATVTSGERHD
jgi:hypothetical protein